MCPITQPSAAAIAFLAAIAGGRNELMLMEVGGWKILLGLAVYFARFMHHRLFGAHPLL